MALPSRDISVTAPVRLAFERVKWMLFQPFDLAKWFVIGFCAWLAGLGESGAQVHFNTMHSNFPANGKGPPANAHSFRDVMDEALRYVLQNLQWIIPLAVALVILGLAWGILLAWLNSRGKFMFLHCVALNQAEVKRPWHAFAREGQSLFWFRIVLGAIAILLFLPLIGGIFFAAGWMLYHEHAGWVGILLIAGLGMICLALALVCWLIQKFTTDFVVPVMFLRRTTCTVAWSEFLGLLRANAGPFALYVLFQFVLTMATGLLVVLVVLATCCLAGCLMVLPYVGTVVLLPVLVFDRSYSLYYLAQFGPAYAAFPAGPPLPPTSPDGTSPFR